MLGEVRREGQAFTAELRGLADRLSQETGRLYTAHLRAPISATRAAASISTIRLGAAGRGRRAVAASRSLLRRASTVSPTAGSPAGKLTFTSGANAGSRDRGEAPSLDGDSVTIDAVAGDGRADRGGRRFVVTAGCDKRFATCRDRFDNALNFRGFPHIPGNDFIVATPVPGNGDVGARRTAAVSGDIGVKGDGIEASAADPSEPRTSTAPLGRQVIDMSEQSCHRTATSSREARELDRHALSASGLAERRRLRLSRPGARGLARAAIGEEPERVPAYSRDWAEAGGARDAGATPALRHLVPVARDADRSRATCCCFAGAPACVAKHAAIAAPPERDDPRP